MNKTNIKIFDENECADSFNPSIKRVECWHDLDSQEVCVEITVSGEPKNEIYSLDFKEFEKRHGEYILFVKSVLNSNFCDVCGNELNRYYHCTNPFCGLK